MKLSLAPMSVSGDLQHYPFGCSAYASANRTRFSEWCPVTISRMGTPFMQTNLTSPTERSGVYSWLSQEQSSFRLVAILFLMKLAAHRTSFLCNVSETSGMYTSWPVSLNSRFNTRPYGGFLRSSRLSDLGRGIPMPFEITPRVSLNVTFALWAWKDGEQILQHKESIPFFVLRCFFVGSSELGSVMGI